MVNDMIKDNIATLEKGITPSTTFNWINRYEHGETWRNNTYYSFTEIAHELLDKLDENKKYEYDIVDEIWNCSASGFIEKNAKKSKNPFWSLVLGTYGFAQDGAIYSVIDEGKGYVKMCYNGAYNGLCQQSLKFDGFTHPRYWLDVPYQRVWVDNMSGLKGKASMSEYLFHRFFVRMKNDGKMVKTEPITLRQLRLKIAAFLAKTPLLVDKARKIADLDWAMFVKKEQDSYAMDVKYGLKPEPKKPRYAHEEEISGFVYRGIKLRGQLETMCYQECEFIMNSDTFNYEDRTEGYYRDMHNDLYNALTWMFWEKKIK